MRHPGYDIDRIRLSLNEGERVLLKKLLTTCELIPGRISTFLQQEFFTETSGRALILQPGRRFGYYYLPGSLFDQPEQLMVAIKELFDLFTLIARLRADRFIYILRSESTVAEPMLFLSSGFNSPKIDDNCVVLNQQGDYTTNPEVIQDKKGNVKYRGIRLDGEAYSLIHEQTQGMLYVTHELRSVLAANEVPHYHHTVAETPPQATDVEQASLIESDDNDPSHDKLSAGCNDNPLPSNNKPERFSWRKKVFAGFILVGSALITGFLHFLGEEEGRGFLHFLEEEEGHSFFHLAINKQNIVSRPDRNSAQTQNQIPTQQSNVQLSVNAQQLTHNKEGNHYAQLFGFDISKWNGKITAELLGDPKLAFLFTRAAYGLKEDPNFRENWRQLGEQQSLIRGAYHFFLFHEDPIEQARYFLDLIGHGQTKDLCPAVDFEELSFSFDKKEGPSVSDVQQKLLVYLDYLEQKTGCAPILYTNLEMGNHYLNHEKFSRYPLWIADWTAAPTPRLPTAWSSAGYHFWQRTANYTLAGKSNVPLNLDLFSGDHQQLRTLLRINKLLSH